MVRINEDFVVDVDQTCYTLKRDTHKDDKNGKRVYSPIGFYGSLDSALESFFNVQVKSRLSDGEHSIHDAIIAIREERDRVQNIIECVK